MRGPADGGGTAAQAAKPGNSTPNTTRHDIATFPPGPGRAMLNRLKTHKAGSAMVPQAHNE
jgi:hypothetical protein